MELNEDVLYLFYVKDIERENYSPENFPYIATLSEEEEVYTKAGYFDSIYADDEEEE